MGKNEMHATTVFMNGKASPVNGPIEIHDLPGIDAVKLNGNAKIKKV